MPTRTATPHRPRRGRCVARWPQPRNPRRRLSASGRHRPGAVPADGGEPALADPRRVRRLPTHDQQPDGRPYEDATINAYVFPAKALGAWMTANSLDGDFTTVDTVPAQPVLPRVLPGVTRHAEWARMGRETSGSAGMTGGACGVVVAGDRVGTTEWERPARLKFAA